MLPGKHPKVAQQLLMIMAVFEKRPVETDPLARAAQIGLDLLAKGPADCADRQHVQIVREGPLDGVAQADDDAGARYACRDVAGCGLRPQVMGRGLTDRDLLRHIAKELEVILPARHEATEALRAQIAAQILGERAQLALDSRPLFLAEMLRSDLGCEVVGLLERRDIDAGVLAEIFIKRGGTGLRRADDEEIRKLHGP